MAIRFVVAPHRAVLRASTIAAGFGITFLALWFAFAPGSSGQARMPGARMPMDYTARFVEIPGEPIQPIPLDLGVDGRKVELGRRLFGDPRLSRDGTIACASCHAPAHDFADVTANSRGIAGKVTKVNVPTVRNSRFSIAQFWDGRAETLEAQVDGPLLNAGEMGGTWPEVIRRLEADPLYAAASRAIYDAPLSPAIVRQSIAEYERSLVSSGSRFDAFLRGKDEALSDAEKTGYRLFKEYGCSACHQGAAVGGNLFQRLGIFGDYFADRGGSITMADLGRFNVTGDEADRYVFKVPSLREAAFTAPYFHDGSIPTLEKAIAAMARYQLGREMPAKDIELIAAFLRTLSGTDVDGAP